MLYLRKIDINMEQAKIEAVEQTANKVIVIRNTQVILDKDVAEIYGVTTRRVNEAVKNNPERFPDVYVITLETNEKKELVENFDRFRTLKHSTVMPKAFTERGLYMLATILKSKVATEATISIIETFSKLRELSRAIEVANSQEKEPEPKKFQKLMKEVLTDNLPVKMRKTAFTFNLGFLKISLETTREKEK